MPRFKKRPVEIEAFQMTRKRRGDNSEWPDWLNRAWNLDVGTAGAVYPSEPGTGDGLLLVCTLEGELAISWDDWIIQGVKGELYPCKPDIFEATYRPAETRDRAEVRVLDKGYGSGVWLNGELFPVTNVKVGLGDPPMTKCTLEFYADVTWVREPVPPLLFPLPPLRCRPNGSSEVAAKP